MKRINEKQKITLTLGQLKNLVRESNDENGEGKRCKWVAWSDDGSYEEDSNKTFEYQEDAYKDMAKSAVSKMLWNTEPADFNYCESIEYQVVFTPTAISHDSYSGTYVWAIIDEDKTLTDKEKEEIENQTWSKLHWS